MGRGEPGIVPGLTTQLLYFRQEKQIRQPGSRAGTFLIPTCFTHSNLGVLIKRSDLQRTISDTCTSPLGTEPSGAKAHEAQALTLGLKPRPPNRTDLGEQTFALELAGSGQYHLLPVFRVVVDTRTFRGAKHNAARH